VTADVDIRACLGAEAAAYAANKHRGGSSGQKGTRYEDFFIAHKLAQAAVALVENPAAADPHIQGQSDGFVDDVRIACANKTDYFQLKNQHAVSWLAGEHPIATDFAYQARLCQYRQEPAPSTHLVVSKAELAHALRTAIPATIQGHTQVEHFPWSETANRLVLECAELRELLRKLAHVENASQEALTGVLCALLTAHIENPEGATVRELLACAQAMFPKQLRLTPALTSWEEHLRPDFKQVLARISGLTYGAPRGFFQWSGFGTSGVFASDVTSDEFSAFQDHVIQQDPKTFEAFEGLLP
jgi:hypothetical protein